MNDESDESPLLTEDAGRVKVILREVYAGNQHELARAVGCAQSLISRIVNGKRAPGRKFLEKLARLSGCRPEWVLRGEGEMRPQDTRGTLPIAACPLAGSPRDAAALMTGERYPVAASFADGDRYLLRVLPESELAQCFASLVPGDLILFDSDPACTQNLDFAFNRFCVVNFRAGSLPCAEVGLLLRAGDVILARGGTVGYLRLPNPPLQYPGPVEAGDDRPRRRRNVRSLEDEPMRAARRMRAPATPIAPARREFGLEDIAAVALQLIRPMPMPPIGPATGRGQTSPATDLTV